MKEERINEARKLLCHLFGKDYNECLQILEDHKDQVLSLFQSAPELEKELEDSLSPTKEALLTFKDQLRIPDSKWQFVLDTFGLSKEFSLHHIRKLRNEWDSFMVPKKTIGGKGSELNIEELLTYLIRCSPPNDPSKPIQVKFAFDGATVTSGKKIKEEIGTVEILSEKSASEAKSYLNAAQWLVYTGSEDRETLGNELKRAIATITKLQEEKRVKE